MASINVEFSAFRDPRIKVLGKLTQLSWFDALGRLAAIWAYCTEKTVTELPALVIDVLAEFDGYAVHLVEADLGELLSDGRVRIRGTAGRIEWLARARARQRAATEAASRNRVTRTAPKLTSAPTSAPTLVTSSSSSPTSKKRKNADSAESTLLWGYYSEKAKSKAITPVHEGAKTNILCKRLVDEHGIETAKRMVDAFLADSDPFVREQAWSIGLLVALRQKYLNRVSTGAGGRVLDFGEGA